MYSRVEQSRAEQSRAEQSRAEQSRAEQSRAEQSRAEQSSTAQHSTAQHSTAQHSTAQHSTAQYSISIFRPFLSILFICSFSIFSYLCKTFRQNVIMNQLLFHVLLGVKFVNIIVLFSQVGIQFSFNIMLKNVFLFYCRSPQLQGQWTHVSAVVGQGY